jgi:hypothetical protein
VDARLQTRQHHRYSTLGEAQCPQENRQTHDSLALAVPAYPLRVVAEGVSTGGAAVAHGAGLPNLGIDEELGYRLVALKKGAAAPAASLRATFGKELDLGDEKSYLHCRDASF